MDHLLLLELGIEGGGSCVYLLPDNSVIETTGSGGIGDHAEDPLKEWTRKFPYFDEYWQHFIDEYQEHWIKFYPLFIHPEIAAIVSASLEDYHSDKAVFSMHCNSWFNAIHKSEMAYSPEINPFAEPGGSPIAGSEKEFFDWEMAKTQRALALMPKEKREQQQKADAVLNRRMNS